MPTAKRAISSRVTVENPRPRKYASAAERQKALRERFPTLCVRVEQKQADFVKRIADEIGRTQQDVHLAMVKYALSRPNNQWLTQGLEGFKPLPQFQEGVMTLWRFNKVTGYWIPERKVTAETKEQWLEIFQEDNPDDTFVVSERKPRNAPVKENPMKRKPTPAQIAARERFAEMARSGVFKKKAKRNPAKKTVSQKISQLTREGYPQKQAVAIALSEERAGKVKRNPRASNPIILVSDKPKRVTRKSNPTKPKSMTVYQVQYRRPGMKLFEPWTTVMYLPMAKDIARRLADDPVARGWTIKVESLQVKG